MLGLIIWNQLFLYWSLNSRASDIDCFSSFFIEAVRTRMGKQFKRKTWLLISLHSHTSTLEHNSCPEDGPIVLVCLLFFSSKDGSYNDLRRQRLEWWRWRCVFSCLFLCKTQDLIPCFKSIFVDESISEFTKLLRKLSIDLACVSTLYNA